MSHNKIRSEKTCLNCGADVPKRFCPECGQENAEPKQSVWHIVTHFFNDITHFDGRFFSTMKMLLLRPGYLSAEYLKGRRTSYLDPVRMFLFISATFFLLPLDVNVNQGKEDSEHNKKTSQLTPATQSDIEEINKDLIKENRDTLYLDTVSVKMASKGTGSIYVNNKEWLTEKTVAQYDSVQNSLPDNKRDGWVKHYFSRKLIAARELSHENSEAFTEKFSEKFFHSLHYMLFITLPFIALILKMLYVRRKQYYYVSHIIFALHYYCVVFILLVLAGVLKMTGSYASYITPFIHLGYIIYLYVAMKRFYMQGVFKTFIKYVLLLFIGSTVIGLLTLITLANSILNVAA